MPFLTVTLLCVHEYIGVKLVGKGRFVVRKLLNCIIPCFFGVFGDETTQ